MKPSSVIKQKSKKNTTSKSKLTIHEEPNSKFKNELFQKLCERNNSTKGKTKTITYDDSKIFAK